MTPKQEEALRDYLREAVVPLIEDVLAKKLGQALTFAKEELAQPAQQDSTCSNALRAQGKAYPRTCKKCGLGPCIELAQQALDKKAENARELGLDYEPAPVQATMKLESSGPGHGPAPNQKLSVRHVSLIDAGKTAAQRPWLDLTDEQIETIESLALTKNMAIVMTMRTLKEVNT